MVRGRGGRGWRELRESRQDGPFPFLIESVSGSVWAGPVSGVGPRTAVDARERGIRCRTQTARRQSWHARLRSASAVRPSDTEYPADCRRRSLSSMEREGIRVCQRLGSSSPSRPFVVRHVEPPSPCTVLARAPSFEGRIVILGRTDELPVLGEEHPASGPRAGLVLVLVPLALAFAFSVPRAVPCPLPRAARRTRVGPVDAAADDVAGREGRAERFAGALAAKGAAVVGVVAVPARRSCAARVSMRPRGLDV